MFVVRRQTYKPIRRPPSNPNKKRKQAGLNQQLDEAIEELVSTLLARCDELATKFKKTKDHIRSRVFGGSKSKSFLSRRRVGKTIRVWDAYVHHRAKEFNSEEAVERRGRKLVLKEIRAQIRQEERHYTDYTKEEQQAWVQAYRVHRAKRNVEKRINRKAEQQDASYVFKLIAQEIETLELRTGVKAFFVTVRSNQLQVIQPFYACSPDIVQFFNIILGKTLDEIIAMFEMWAIGGVQSVLGVNAKSVGDVKKDVRRVIQNGYTQILAKRYPERPVPPQETMNYASYDEAVVKKHGVRLIGWTYDNGKVCQPGNITRAEEVRKLYTALITEECRWELIPDDEWDPSEHLPKKRKERSDAGKPRKKRKTGPDSSEDVAAPAGPANATSGSSTRKSQRRTGKAAPARKDRDSDEEDEET